ncbi:MAG: hypothetical protein C4532_08040 [Candidatus Abyssobacteria bacterium SURF_17]|uniref:Glycosyltransferase RgtA/B/C/D-like domain-containing protein n=1 Tax=Candidatus Abyssobacteria bacterium SURF_17 TaxID=2093361 RepID=A0A419EZV2_9BACT|nr:MAG: hypothetical protein C4532_08040 [Candidatus Abyssubacteria bacterium SURF_17]
MSQQVKVLLLKYRWFILISVAAFAHRGLMFLNVVHILRNVLDDLEIFRHSSLICWQHLTIPALSEHLGKSILYLQQTPPIPNIILGLGVKVFGWPHGTTYFLIFFQTLLSIGTTLLLFNLLARVTGNKYFSCIVSLVFVLSTDLLVMEYNSCGQAFYENLAMFLLLLTVYYYGKVLHTGKPIYSVALGLTTGAMALTRASFSYFFVVPAFLLLPLVRAAQPKKSLHNIIIYFVCLFGTQFAWCAKNYAVYGTLNIAASSWAGHNFLSGIMSIGKGDLLKRSILAEEGKYPKWFIEMVRIKGLQSWPYTLDSKVEIYLPSQVQRDDKRIQVILQNSNRPQNSVAERVISDLYMRACVRFYLKNPRIAAAKFLASYKLFWQPMRNYSNKLVNPLFTYPNLVNNSFNLNQIIRASLSEGFCKNQFVYSTLVSEVLIGGRSACFFTVPALPVLMLGANIIAVHIIAPIILICSAISVLRGRKALFGREYFYLLGTLIYCILVMNLPDHGENMRFRLSVEPLIWLFSIFSSVILFQSGLSLSRKLQSYLKPLLRT